MDYLNTKTKDVVDSLADAGVTIPMTTAARILGMSSARQLQRPAERGELPFVVEVTYPGESKRRFRVVTARFSKYLIGDLDTDMQNGGAK